VTITVLGAGRLQFELILALIFKNSIENLGKSWAACWRA
jgi:hypothetical protein